MLNSLYIREHNLKVSLSYIYKGESLFAPRIGNILEPGPYYHKEVTPMPAKLKMIAVILGILTLYQVSIILSHLIIITIIIIALYLKYIMREPRNGQNN